MHRFFKVLGRILLALVVLVVVLYVGYGVAAMYDAHQNRQQAREEIERGLPEAEAAATGMAGTIRRDLGVGQARHTWSELTCSVATNEGGWMVLDYVNACTLVRVELVPVAGRSDSECAPVAVRTFDVWPEPMASRGPASSCEDLLQAEGREARAQRTRLVSGERPEALTGSDAWLVVRTPAVVSETVIGCHRWSVIFCDEPSGLPVLPKD